MGKLTEMLGSTQAEAIITKVVVGIALLLSGGALTFVQNTSTQVSKNTEELAFRRHIIEESVDERRETRVFRQQVMKALGDIQARLNNLEKENN